VTTAAEPGSVGAAGTYSVNFEPRGAAQLGGQPVGLQLAGLLVDDQRRIVLAEVPVWPGLQAPTAVLTSRPGAMAFWRGRAYYTAPDGATINVRDCDGGITQFIDIRHHDLGLSDPAVVEVPDLASLATTPRDTLLVADRRSGKVREFDLFTAQSVWSWHDLDGVDDVTVAAGGVVYATCDRGIVRLDPYEGATDVVPIKQATSQPKSLAWARVDGADVLFLALGIRIIVIEVTDGTLRVRGRLPVQPLPAAAAPLAVRWHAARLYVASPADHLIRVFDTTTASLLGDLPGRIPDYSAFGLDEDGSLWITDGISAERSGASRAVDHGSARLGPMPIKLDQATDHTLRIRLVGRLTSADAVVSAEFIPHSIEPAGETSDTLVRVPPDATSVVVLITLTAAASTAAGRQQSHVTAVELRVDEPGWIDQLPSIYRDPASHPDLFLDPFLRLAKIGIDEVIDSLLTLPAQIDPSTSIDDLDGDRWLDWLAGWVDVQLDETMPADVRREMVAGAFARHGTRGTADNLRDQIALELGLTSVEIVQPGDVASVWVLGADSGELGMRTMTAAAPPSGSILDSTAAAERSHLIGPADYGAPLFGDLANRFDVLVHAALIGCPDDRERLEALIERERPAHTTAHLCVIEPGISVGIQARVGVDAVIGGGRHQHALSGLDGFTAGARPDRAVLGEGGTREGLVLT
jgi:phage tail-like protein